MAAPRPAATTEYDAAGPPPAEPGLGLRQLAFDPYLLVIPPDWQVTARSLRDLAGRPWVAGPPGTACDHALQRSTLPCAATAWSTRSLRGSIIQKLCFRFTEDNSPLLLYRSGPRCLA
jgi:hypothetical protein